jgi:hypothetical protein
MIGDLYYYRDFNLSIAVDAGYFNICGKPNWFILPDTKIELEVHRTMDQNSPRYLPNVAMSLLLHQ